jgi:hypothetical protein
LCPQTIEKRSRPSVENEAGKTIPSITIINIFWSFYFHNVENRKNNNFKEHLPEKKRFTVKILLLVNIVQLKIMLLAFLWHLEPSFFLFCH